MTLMQRLRDQHNATINAQGYQVRRSDSSLKRCPDCGATMDYQEWKHTFAATTGRDTCGRCGYTSQRFAIA